MTEELGLLLKELREIPVAISSSNAGYPWEDDRLREVAIAMINSAREYYTTHPSFIRHRGIFTCFKYPQNKFGPSKTLLYF